MGTPTKRKFRRHIHFEVDEDVIMIGSPSPNKRKSATSGECSKLEENSNAAAVSNNDTGVNNEDHDQIKQPPSFNGIYHKMDRNETAKSPPSNSLSTPPTASSIASQTTPPTPHYSLLPTPPNPHLVSHSTLTNPHIRIIPVTPSPPTPHLVSPAKHPVQDHTEQSANQSPEHPINQSSEHPLDQPFEHSTNPQQPSELLPSPPAEKSHKYLPEQQTELCTKTPSNQPPEPPAFKLIKLPTRQSNEKPTVLHTDLLPDHPTQPLSGSFSPTSDDTSDNPAGVPSKNFSSHWHTSVSDRLKMVYYTNEFSDCTVCCVFDGKQKTFSCHKVVLSMTSSKLRSLLVNADICINLKPEVFEVLLQYMYCDSFVVPSMEAACDVHQAALQYDMPHLLGLARESILKELSLDNFWRAFGLAVDFGDRQLKLGCNMFLAENPSLWNTLHKVEKPLLPYVLDLKEVNVSEETILKALDRWADQQCSQLGMTPNHQNKRHIVGLEILAKIRFLVIKPPEFVSYCNCQDSLLTIEEMFSILRWLTVPHSCQLPPWVCILKTSRGTSEALRVKRRIYYTFSPLHDKPGAESAYALSGPTRNNPIGSKHFSIFITANENIVLHGIQVPALWYPPFNQEGNSSYEENYFVEVRDQENNILLNFSTILDVQFASTVDVMFNQRIFLDANVEYSINISTTKTYYLTHKFWSSECQDSVKFSFKDSSVHEITGYGHSVNDAYEHITQFSFVLQLIFSVFL